MFEFKRVFLNRIWIILSLVLLAANIFFFCKFQTQKLGVSVNSYAEHVHTWGKRLSGHSPENGLQLVDARISTIEQSRTAQFLLQTSLNEGVIPEGTLLLYKDKYPEIEIVINELRNDPAKAIIDEGENLALKHWKMQLEYLSNYATRSDQITKQAQQIQTNPLFAKEASFEYRNAQKTANDYAESKNYATGILADDVLTSLVEYEADIIFNIGIVFLAILLLLSPFREGVETLIRTTPRGRGSVAIIRVGIILFVSFISVILSTTSQLLTACILYKQPVPFNVLVQNLELFQNWTAKTTCLEFLLWYVTIKSAGISVVGMLLWVILSNLKSNVLGLILCIFCLLSEFLLFKSFKPNDSGYWLATYNLFHLLLLNNVIKRYLNYNIFGFPVNEKVAICVVLIIFLLVLITVSFWLAHKKTTIYTHKRAFFNRAVNLNGRFANLLFFEFKKIYIYSLGFVIAVAGFICILCVNPTGTALSQKEALYLDYLHQYSGPVCQETYTDIKAHENNTRLEYIGALNQQVDRNALAYYEAQYWAMSQLVLRYQDLLNYQEAGIDQLYLFDESVYDQIYGYPGSQYRTSIAILSLLLMSAFIPILIFIEDKHKAKDILWSSPHGRKTLWRKKLVVLFSFVFLLWIIWFLNDMYQYSYIGETTNLSSINALSISSWGNPSESHSIAWHIFCLIFHRFVLLNFWGSICLFISLLASNYLMAVGINITISLVPYLLTVLGMSWLEPISLTNWLIESPPYPLWTSITLLSICVITSCLLQKLAILAWKGTPHIIFD